MINSTWRVRLMKMDLHASPTDWKKLVVVIWKPATQNMAVPRRSVLTLAAMRVASLVNNREMASGKNWQAMHPNVVITVQMPAAIQNVRIRRSKRLAP